jgi:hypothetical protein
MKYSILTAHKSTGQIQVAYKDDDENVVATYAIDVPVIGGKFITGDELHAEIVHRAPTWIMNRKNDVAQADNFHHIEALVVQKPKESTTLTASQIQNIEMWEKTQFEGKIAEVLVKYGLLDKNPAIIEVTKL